MFACNPDGMDTSRSLSGCAARPGRRRRRRHDGRIQAARVFEPVTDMVGGGPFDLPAGAWTDDTSMALCLAESLIERKGFDRSISCGATCAGTATGTGPAPAPASTSATPHAARCSASSGPASRSPATPTDGRRQRAADEAGPGGAGVRQHPAPRSSTRRERADDPGAPQAIDAAATSPGCSSARWPARSASSLHQGSSSPSGPGTRSHSTRDRRGRSGLVPGQGAARDPGTATSSTRSRRRCGRSGRPRHSRTACSPRSTSATTPTPPPRSTDSSAGAFYGVEGIPAHWASRSSCATRSSSSPTSCSTWRAGADSRREHHDVAVRTASVVRRLPATHRRSPCVAARSVRGGRRRPAAEGGGRRRLPSRGTPCRDPRPLPARGPEAVPGKTWAARASGSATGLSRHGRTRPAPDATAGAAERAEPLPDSGLVDRTTA